VTLYTRPRGRFLYGEWQPLVRDERSRTFLPSVDRAASARVAKTKTEEAAEQPAGASARQVPGVPRLFVLITALVLLFFGCIR
jgi:hypothetical protein